MRVPTVICFVFLIMLQSQAQGFLHRDGKRIVDGNGDNVLLRGLGLGGWMVQEGYMLQTAAFAGTQREIRQKITELIGAEDTEAFYQKYRDNNVTKRDIDSLKAWGFNSIRLPMHYNLYTLPIELEKPGQNTWLAEGFERTDKLLEWCAQNRMYLILDLHAAPGGQGKDANISDYDPAKPGLWESNANTEKTIALWVKLAERYKNSPWIGGYDLINEPNWNFSGTNQNGCDEAPDGNGPLRDLQLRLTQAIRKVDQKHLIILEGNCWGNNYNGMFPLWDDNLVLSFHKYWNNNEMKSIQSIIDLREKHNVPIYLGESGENSNVWFKDAIELVESQNIGWAFWPMKKIDNIAGVTSVIKNAEYQVLLDYWKNGGMKPAVAFAKAALNTMADNFKMENVAVKPDVIDAMFRQVYSDETKPYKKLVVPGIIYGSDYDMGYQGYAYSDSDIATYRTDTNQNTEWNSGKQLRNDGVDIEKCTDQITNGYSVGYTKPNEWLQYTINVMKSGNYVLDLRYSGGGKLHFSDKTGKISETVTIPDTGSSTYWKTFTMEKIRLKAGTNKLRVYFESDGINLNYLQFKKK
ncbi:MAG TPA: cellulase family glycosylhydrolase [Flavobacterium sp.]|jgi:hypothetical protein